MLTAVVDDQRRQGFFGVPLYQEGDFGSDFLQLVSADVVIVMSLEEAERLATDSV